MTCVVMIWIHLKLSFWLRFIEQFSLKLFLTGDISGNSSRWGQETKKLGLSPKIRDTWSPYLYTRAGTRWRTELSRNSSYTPKRVMNHWVKSNQVVYDFKWEFSQQPRMPDLGIILGIYLNMRAFTCINSSLKRSSDISLSTYRRNHG